MADESGNWLQRGWHLIEMRRYEQAEVELRRAVTGQGNRARAFYLLAFAQANQDKLAEAEETAGRSIAENPALGDGYHAKAMVLRLRGRSSEAEKPARRALEIDPKGIEYRSELAWVLIAQNRVSEALSLVEAGLQDFAESVRLHRIRTEALIRLDRLNEAKVSALHTLSLDPEHVESRRQLASIAVKLKQYAESAKYYAEVLRLDPKDHSARTNLVSNSRLSLRYYRLFKTEKGRGVLLVIAVTLLLTAAVARNNDILAVMLLGFIGLSVYSGAIIDPVTTMVLRRNPMVKNALSPDDIACSNYVAILVGSGVLALLVAIAGTSSVMIAVSAVLLALPVPVIRAYRKSGKEQTLRKVYTCALFAIAFVGIAAVAAGHGPAAVIAFYAFGMGILLYESITAALKRIFL